MFYFLLFFSFGVDKNKKKMKNDSWIFFCFESIKGVLLSFHVTTYKTKKHQILFHGGKKITNQTKRKQKIRKKSETENLNTKVNRNFLASKKKKKKNLFYLSLKFGTW